jgi:signal transduction histidine kinase
VQAIDIAREQASRLTTEVQRAAAASALAPVLDLRGALAALCDGVPSLKVSLACDPDTARMGPVLSHVVFRLVQEALSNCVRHADATALHIRLACIGEALSLSIADNGRGAGAVPRTTREGQGLRGMRERVEGQGGSFQAGVREPTGFGISVWLPLLQEART